MISKIVAISLWAFITLFSTLPTDLEGAGWGKTDEVVKFEGVNWNAVYFETTGLTLKAFIPNYSGASLQNNTVSLTGNVNAQTGYAIITSYNPGFTPPKSQKDFTKMVQDANPDHIVTAIDAKALGAKFGIDMAPANSNDDSYWRMITTNDRLIKMGTVDTDANRRTYFFESITLK